MSKLPNNIRTLRVENCYSEKKLADYLGVSPATISNWERGKTLPTIVQANKIKDLFTEEIIFFDQKNN